ncbi:DinB family protein [Actinomadura rudentiformis]|uniref:Mycothiol-dependent maleylpyruvate isomerase metal-binding domain-containing protein n=1 Tax=Actinomadura rudentiformis TaxID=359158 RepID=A0A6H9Y807_9ACTN|nr:hypothetical protein [Actinomadura rudentiformis]KAB2340138.1 hypothetical protein F8566_45535 [Actinomadura rudentiformis]
MTIPWADLPTAATAETLPVLLKGAWSRRAGDTEWTCRTMLSHVVLGAVGYAGSLLAQPPDRPTGLISGTDRHASIHACIEAVEVAATFVSLAVRASQPDIRAYHPWGTSDPSGFAAMAGVEILVHSHDLTRTLGFEWSPPDELCAPILQRLFPDAPTGHTAGQTLLWCTGRVALPGIVQLGHGQWQWDGRVR